MEDQLMILIQLIVGLYVHDMGVMFGPQAIWYWVLFYLVWFPIKWLLVTLPLWLPVALIRQAMS